MTQTRKTKTDNLIMGKVPPHDKELEKVILGTILLEPECLSLVMSKVFNDMFYLKNHQTIFTAIERMYDANKHIDLMTLVEQLKFDGTLETIGGIVEVARLTNSVVSSANIETHILIIAEKYLCRETIKICGDGLNSAYEETNSIWDNIGALDSDIQKMQERVLNGMTKGVAYFAMKVLEQHASVKQLGVIGLSTGLKVIDKVIAGLVAPDLIILAARPGQGKTAMALSITYNTSILSKIPCAWFSLEMDGVQLVRRLASIDTGLDHEKIRNGLTTHDEEIMLGESIDRISSCPIFLEDRANVTIRDIRTKASLHKKKNKIQYIVVDYIQLMEGIDPKGKSRENIISEISRGLKTLAKELEIPIIALSQLSREVEKRPDKMPQLSDLRESGAIEQDADEVIFLMRPEYYKMTEDVSINGMDYSVKGLTIASIAKNRHGSTQNVPLRFRGETMFFSDYENTNQFKTNNNWQ